MQPSFHNFHFVSEDDLQNPILSETLGSRVTLRFDEAGGEMTCPRSLGELAAELGLASEMLMD